MYKRMLMLMCGLLVLGGCASSSDDRGWSDGDRVESRTVTCESRNGEFTDCERIGRSAVVLSRQLSDSPCVEGRSWGVRGGVLWTDDGCRAEFRVGDTMWSGGPVLSGGTMLTCESNDGKLNRCAASTLGGVRLVRQISDSACVFDRTWGWDTRGVWVDGGCRAEFRVGTEATMSRSAIVCESQSNRREHCAANTRYGVELIRQLSDSPCIRNRTWGEDANGVWVTEGCRGEFAVRLP